MSEKKIVTQKIFTGLQEVQLLLHHMEMQGTIHIVEADLLLEKLRNVYNHALSLKIGLGEPDNTEAVLPEINPTEGNITKPATTAMQAEKEQEKLPEKHTEPTLPEVHPGAPAELVVTRSKSNNAGQGEQIVVKTEDIEELSKTPVRKKNIQPNPLANYPKPETEEDSFVQFTTSKPEPVVAPEQKTDEIIKPAEPVEKEQHEKPKQDKQTKSQVKKTSIVADQFENKAPSVNQKLSERPSSESVASKFQDRPVSDLRKAINLNDKILFIRELFKGSYATYDETLQTLNHITDFSSAMDIVHTLNWDMDNEVSVRFIEILKRKFA